MDVSADWPGYDKFNQVQELLDKNSLLVSQINSNHAARTAEALQRNVLLIRELNANIAKVVELYRELSETFTNEATAPQGPQPSGQDPTAPQT
eukprot:jgi/Chrzof1/10516/Cz05g01200.t1